MDGIDTTLRGDTVEQFRATLLDAAEHIDVVQPPALREPISLWLRGLEERARREGWRHLLGRPVVAAWNAARAILATRSAGGVMDARTTALLRGRASWADCTPVAIPPERLAQLETAWGQAERWSIAHQVADPLHDDFAFLDHFEQHLFEEVVRGAVKAGRALLTNTGPLWSVRPLSFGGAGERVDFENAAHGVEWKRGAPLPFAGDPVWLMCRMSGLSIPLLPEES